MNDLTPKNLIKTIIIALCFISLQLAAQIKLEGVVKHNGKPLSGADVIITNSAGSEKELMTNSSGSYSYTLQPNDEYNITISKVGFTQFQIIYSTMGLTGDLAKKIKSVSRPESELFELPTDQATILKLNAILDKPLISYYYNSENNTIENDESLEHSLSQDLAKVAKLSGGQSSTLEVNYKNAVSKGDAAALAKNYPLAKISYEEAIAIKPTEQYPKTKLSEIEKNITDAETKIKADAAEKERLAKEKLLADAAAKEKTEKDKVLADAAAKEKADKDRALADAAAQEKADKDKAAADLAEKQRLDKEKSIADAAEKDRLAKAAAAAEKDRLAKEKNAAEAAAKEKEIAAAAEKDRLAKEKSEKDKALADAAEKERLEKEKAKADAIAKEKAAADKAAAELAEKDRLAKEAEMKLLQSKYDNAIAKGDSALKVKNFDLAKTSYAEAASIKPKEALPGTKIKEADAAMELDKRSQYTNELAKKYPQGVTEEIVKEGNVKITKRIVVLGNKGTLYTKKETGFGAVYYFKDGVSISEAEFVKNTESVK